MKILRLLFLAVLVLPFTTQIGVAKTMMQCDKEAQASRYKCMASSKVADCFLKVTEENRKCLKRCLQEDKNCIGRHRR